MALTVTNLYKWTQQQGEFIVIIQVTGDTAYPNTGGTVGYPITAATFSLTTFASTSDFQLQSPPTVPYFQLGNVDVSGAGGFTKLDGTTSNLRFFGSTGTEITNGSTAAATSAILMAFGH
jgi:hypothetical protein